MSGAKQFRAAVVIGYMLSITWLRRNLLSLVWLFATPFSLPLVLLSLAGVWLFSSAIGYLVSTFTSNLRNGWQSGLLLSVLVGILPPVFYPAEILPHNILLVTYAIPTTNAALLIRDSMGTPPTLPYWSPLIGWLLIATSLAIALAVTARVAR